MTGRHKGPEVVETMQMMKYMWWALTWEYFPKMGSLSRNLLFDLQRPSGTQIFYIYIWLGYPIMR